MISKKFWIPGLLAVVLGLSCASCSVVESMFADKVVTTISNVKEERRGEAVPADLGTLPSDMRQKLADAGETLVIVPKEDVVDPMEKTVELVTPGEGWVEGALGMGLSIANTMWPGVAALEGLGVLFSRRKRQHYAAAASAAVPTNGKMELKDAVVSLGRAIGVAHSSESSKVAYEEDQGWEYEEEEDEEAE
jgi:hypothetical protein